MALIIGDNFSYKAKKPLDARLQFDSVTNMVAAAEATLYDGLLAYIPASKTFYVFDSANDEDVDVLGDDGVTVEHQGLGKWREFIAGVSPEEFEQKLNDIYTKTETDSAIADKIAEIVAEADSDFDTLKEIADWIKSDTTGAAKMASDIAQNTSDIADLQGALDDVSAKTTKDIKANITVGGIVANTTVPKDTEFTDFVEKLIYKEIAPTVSVTTSVSTPRELGTSVAAGATYTLNITNSSSMTVTPTKIEFFNGDTLLDTKDFVAGTFAYTYTTVDAIDSTTTIKGVLTYGDEAKTVSASTTTTFVMPTFYGIVNSLTNSNDDIIALTKNVKTGKGFTWNGITMNNARTLYAIPTSLGALTAIKDANNFEYLSSYTRTTETITTSTGQSASYYVYTLTDPVSVDGFRQVYS